LTAAAVESFGELAVTAVAERFAELAVTAAAVPTAP
jgi:hypothetical protein